MASLPPIGWVRHNFLPPSETFIYAALSALTEAEVDVRVFAINRRSREKFPDAQVTALTEQRFGHLEAAQYWLTGTCRSHRAWASSVKLVHAHMGYTGAHALRVAAERSVPLVTSFYGRDVTLAHARARLSPAYLPYTLMQKRLFERGDRFVVLSEHMRAALVAQGCPEEKTRVVRIGIDPNRFTPVEDAAANAATFRVLLVGREVQKKGFDDGLRACAQAAATLESEGVHLKVTLLGTGGPLEGSLRALGRQLKLDLDWPDPSTRVPQAMQRADILLVPSRTADNGDQEGTPTVICEGGAAGLSVVATRHAGIPDQIDHDRTGLLVDERDVDALADALVRLARQPERRVAFGRAARQKVIREFSIAAHRDGLLSVYEELLASWERTKK